MSFPLHSSAVRRAFLPLLMVFALCFAACGGGGGGGGSPVVTPPPVPDLAPATVEGRTLVFTDPDQPTVKTTYAFTATTFSSPGGDSGSFTYAKVANTTTQAKLQIASVFVPARSYQLTFTSSSGGTYVDQVGKSGTFTIQ